MINQKFQSSNVSPETQKTALPNNDDFVCADSANNDDFDKKQKNAGLTLLNVLSTMTAMWGLMVFGQAATVSESFRMTSNDLCDGKL